MNAHRMDSETVERLLVGRDADPQRGPEALVRLLTAVRAAPRPTELVGEGAALQAFRMARSGSLTVPAAPPRRRVLACALSAKVALAGLLVAGTGGVALAAATGTLPGPLGGTDEVTAPPPSASADARRSPTGGPDSSAAAPSSTSGPPGATPALRQLCAAYRAQPGEERRRLLEAPRFAELVTAAGDRNGVDGYCDRLLDGRHESGSPGASPPGRAGATPTSRVTSRPERIPVSPPAVPATPSNPATTVTPGAPTTTAHRPVGPAVQVPTTVRPGTR